VKLTDKEPFYDSAAHVEADVVSAATIQTNHHVAYGAVVWSRGTLLGGSGGLKQRILDDVELYIKQFVVAWSAAN
jgi:hypothetical protein